MYPHGYLGGGFNNDLSVETYRKELHLAPLRCGSFMVGICFFTFTLLGKSALRMSGVTVILFFWQQVTPFSLSFYLSKEVCLEKVAMPHYLWKYSSSLVGNYQAHCFVRNALSVLYCKPDCFDYGHSSKLIGLCTSFPFYSGGSGIRTHNSKL